jgi:hypothetical protein
MGPYAWNTVSASQGKTDTAEDRRVKFRVYWTARQLQEEWAPRQLLSLDWSVAKYSEIHPLRIGSWCFACNSYLPANYVIWKEEDILSVWPACVTWCYYTLPLRGERRCILHCFSIFFVSTKGLNLTLLSGPLSCGIAKYFWTEFHLCQKTL